MLLLFSRVLVFSYRDNRDFFDITTTVFLERVFYPFLFWRNEFLKINDGKPEKYGVVWILFTYVIIMGLSSNLNLYFITPTNYKFDNEIMTRSFGIVVIFKIAEPLIYTAVIGCLGGFIQNNHVNNCFNLVFHDNQLLCCPLDCTHFILCCAFIVLAFTDAGWRVRFERYFPIQKLLD